VRVVQLIHLVSEPMQTLSVSGTAVGSCTQAGNIERCVYSRTALLLLFLMNQ
jgi:hypothetical protein